MLCKRYLHVRAVLSELNLHTVCDVGGVRLLRMGIALCVRQIKWACHGTVQLATGRWLMYKMSLAMWL